MMWFAVRCVFEISTGTYEERVTLWHCEDLDSAIELAEREAREYVEVVGIHGYCGLAQAFEVGPVRPDSGDEIFSLVRDSGLPPQDYLSTYFDTGRERQGGVTEN